MPELALMPDFKAQKIRLKNSEKTEFCGWGARRHRFNEVLTIPRSSLSYCGGTGAGRSRQSHEKPSGVTPGRLFPFPCAKCSGCPAFRRDIMRIVRTFHAG